MARVTNYGSADALKQSGELNVPLVVIKEILDGKVEYRGFIPGIKFNFFTAKTKTECESGLKLLASGYIKEYAKNNKDFPFFPNKKDIYEEYSNVVSVSFIKIKSSKR